MGCISSALRYVQDLESFPESFRFPPQFGPCIAPVIGGGLVQGLGWRSVSNDQCSSTSRSLSLVILGLLSGLFVFALVFGSQSCFCMYYASLCSSILLLPGIRVFPETLRAMVGDGSIPAPHYSRALIPIIGRHQQGNNGERPPPKPLANPFRIFLNLDVDAVLLFNGIVNAVFYAVIASISSLFDEVYPFLNTTDIGLCFLAIGGGSVIGSVATGKILDREYQTIKVSYEKKLIAQGNTLGPINTKDTDFPVEIARFRTMPIYLLVLAGGTIGYGWCLDKTVHISVPLILLFFSKTHSFMTLSLLC